MLGLPHVSTSESGGTYWGRDFGTGIVFNSLAYGNQFKAATYYFYGYYTPNNPTGGTDPCVNFVTQEPQPQWAVLHVAKP